MEGGLGMRDSDLIGRFNRCLQPGRDIKWFFNKYRGLVKTNRKFRGMYDGKRCFILGNGPSLNQHNLSLLKDEFVFCVNEFVRFEKITNVCPNFYVVADSKFFELDYSDEEDRSFIDKVKHLKDINSDVLFFAPIYAKQSVEKYGWSDVFSTYYFKNGIYFDDSYKKEIHLDAMIPSMNAVVQYAVLIAIYMGFNEIILLGTEQTNIFGNLRAFMSSNEISEYAFSMTEKERAWKNCKLTEFTLPDTLRGYARIFEIYESLYRYCKYWGIDMYNCSQETLIQGIPKKSFESVFTGQ